MEDAVHHLDHHEAEVQRDPDDERATAGGRRVRVAGRVRVSSVAVRVSMGHESAKAA
jgi:hypothetical protein